MLPFLLRETQKPKRIWFRLSKIVKNINQMVSAIKNIDKIDRKKCRERVEKYFTAEKMVNGYEKVCLTVLKKY